jgi:hypothetical protein
MAVPNRKLTGVRVVLAVIAVAAVAVILWSNRPSAVPPGPAPESASSPSPSPDPSSAPPSAPPSAPSSASSSAPACTSTADCEAGFRCVVPGVCSRACNVDGDCPAGRRCAELRVMEGAGAPGQGTPAVATTCVRAGPG